METAAYYVALVVTITVPAAGAIWFVVHPFVALWRRAGPAVTYAVVGGAAAAVMWGMYLAREPLLGMRFGVRMPLSILSVVLFAAGIYLRIQVRQLLAPSAILGLPEISADGGSGRLVTEGIYSWVRHPRYVGVWLGVLGCALFANYLTPYLLAVIYIPAVYVITLLEERELRARFGREYVEYSRRVPRFFPRRPSQAADTRPARRT